MIENVVVTVIVPTHNRRRLLEETVDSVLNQSFADWELYIIDDCSTDDTWAWLSANTEEKIHPLRMKTNVERSKARNIALAKAKGDFVLFLDDDDLLTVNALQVLVQSFESFTEAIACIGCFETFDENGKEETHQSVSKTYCTNIYKDYLFGTVAAAGHCLFKTDAFRRIGGWNEESSFAEDHEMWLKITEDQDVILIPDITLKYRVHGQWRPENQHEILNDIRVEAVKNLPVNRQSWGKGILKARKLLPKAEELFDNDQMFRAFFVYLKIAISAPSLLTSPLSRQKTLKPLAKCLLTSYGVRAARKVISLLRKH